MTSDNEDDRIFDLVRDSIMTARDAFPRATNDTASDDVADDVLINLVRLALDEQAESVLRWLDPDGSYQERIENARR